MFLVEYGKTKSYIPVLLILQLQFLDKHTKVILG